MDSAGRAERGTLPDAEEFVRFCYRRRRVSWPELYDEMCAVATRGLFHGMGPQDLAELGIGFSLFETPRLAALSHRIVNEEVAQRSRLAPRHTRTVAARTEAPVGEERSEPEPVSPRLVVAAAAS